MKKANRTQTRLPVVPSRRDPHERRRLRTVAPLIVPPTQAAAPSPLDSLARDGARQMLQSALEIEVDEFLKRHADLRDDDGCRQVVRNGYLPGRHILTGAGPLEVEQPRVRDRRSGEERVVFTSSILPPYLRRSRTVDELIPWLYLKGVSTGDFREALQAIVGPNAPALSSNVVVRLLEEWQEEHKAVSAHHNHS